MLLSYFGILIYRYSEETNKGSRKEEK